MITTSRNNAVVAIRDAHDHVVIVRQDGANGPQRVCGV